jgi:hypothetical protein
MLTSSLHVVIRNSFLSCKVPHPYQHSPIRLEEVLEPSLGVSAKQFQHSLREVSVVPCGCGDASYRGKNWLAILVKHIAEWHFNSLVLVDHELWVIYKLDLVQWY